VETYVSLVTLLTSLILLRILPAPGSKDITKQQGEKGHQYLYYHLVH